MQPLFKAAVLVLVLLSAGSKAQKTHTAASSSILEGILDKAGFGTNGRDLQEGPPPIAPEIGIIFEAIQALIPPLRAYETPISVRFTSYYDDVFWNCIAVYSDNFLDGATKERPQVIVEDQFLHNSANRALCGMQAAATYSFLSVPGARDPFKAAMANLGIIVEDGLNEDVASCGSDINCLQTVAAGNDFVPSIMGHIVAKLVHDFSLLDGFNELGTDGGCIINCRAFKDTTGYKPGSSSTQIRKQRVLQGSRFLKKDKMNKDDSEEEDEEMISLPEPIEEVPIEEIPIDTNWKPLVEDDGQGFFYTQEHVTPQIGQNAAFRALPESDREDRVARVPNYSSTRRIEALEIIERMAGLDDSRKMAVEVFDNKLNVAIALVGSFIGKALTDGYMDDTLAQPGLILSYERLVHYVNGFTHTEYDSIIIAWKEKINYDLIRPTSIIKDWGDELITTWAPGGVQTFPARDFEAYKRVMPHSEYVSGSACLFEALKDYVNGYLTNIGLDTASFPLQFGPFPPGSSDVEPGIVPANELVLFYPNIDAMADAGSQSRLDGGMHFGESVPAAEELCSGIGDFGVARSFNLLG